MTALTGETGVFSQAEDGRCAVAFLARRRPVSTAVRAGAAADVAATTRRLAGEGWRLSVAEMFGRPSVPTAYDTGMAHDVDVAGVFEAPDIASALTGSIALETGGWDRLFRTEWLIGPREFGTVAGRHDRDEPHQWGFLAFWEWNDAWQAATAERRRAYDEECDVAFDADLRSGVNIAGRHRLDWAGSWHHLGVWEVAGLHALETAMREHERVADFMFTTSRHYVGRLTPLADLLEGAGR